MGLRGRDCWDRLRHPARRGQSLVELAFALPVLALIMLGALDLGRVYFDYVRLTNGVSTGALFGTMNPQYVSSSDSADPDNIIFRVVNENSLLATNEVSVKCYQGPSISSTTLRGTSGSCTDSTVASGDIIEVTGSYQFKPLTAQIVGLLPNSYRIKKSVRMVIQ